MTTTGRPQWVRVYTDSTLDGLWTHFRRFETVDAVRERIQGPTAEANALATRDCVRQAREYFLSARSAPLLTKPVLLYYGMVSLGKTLFLLDPGQRYDMAQIERFERQGHGLKQADPPEEGDEYALEKGHVEITSDRTKPRGVFPQLADIVNPGRTGAWLGQRVSILSILRSIPQLDAELRQAFGDQVGYAGLPITHLDHLDGTVELIVDAHAGVGSAEEAQARVPYLDPDRCKFVHSTALHNRPAPGLRLPASEAYKLMVREEFMGAAYTIPPALLGERFDSLLASYVAMYALSIVARYKPHRWARILEGRDSPLLPVVETLMMICERWWPNLLLNRLTNTWINFSQPSYG